MQIPHNLIQCRRKTRINIQEHTIRISHLEYPPQVRNNDLKALRARDLADLSSQARRAAYSFEVHRDFGLGEVAGRGEGCGCVARQRCQDHGGCERERDVGIVVCRVGDGILVVCRRVGPGGRWWGGGHVVGHVVEFGGTRLNV